jgi:V/A-type H+-transporting ATPase subunit B
MVKEYLTVREIVGPLIFMEGVEGAKYNELVEVEFPDGSFGFGNVLEVEDSPSRVPAAWI